MEVTACDESQCSVSQIEIDKATPQYNQTSCVSTMCSVISQDSSIVRLNKIWKPPWTVHHWISVSTLSQEELDILYSNWKQKSSMLVYGPETFQFYSNKLQHNI